VYAVNLTKDDGLYCEVWRALEYPYNRERRNWFIGKECSGIFTQPRSGASPQRWRYWTEERKGSGERTVSDI